MEEIINETTLTQEQKSSVKVTKNSKGYNWEVKVYDANPDIALGKLLEIENKMGIMFGEVIKPADMEDI